MNIIAAAQRIHGLANRVGCRCHQSASLTSEDGVRMPLEQFAGWR
jgi:hypothetical protein